MKPAPFAYHRPESIEDMLDLLRDHGAEAKILAGGQSLVPAMNFRLARPGIILDANRLAALETIWAEAGTVRIGALVRHAAFHAPVADAPLGPLLTRVAHHIAHYPIRQRGTFGGSLAHADPASEWCLVATVLDAEMTVRSAAKTRMIPANAFFKGTFTTDLRPDELLTEIRLPLLDSAWRGGFNEFSRRAGDFALAMALALLRIDGGRITAARLGIGGVADKAIRLGALEQRLVSQAPTGDLFETIARAAAESITPSEDIHASPAFRRDLIRAVVKRALREAIA
ncbi:MAG: xanthine dehydrogenase family protein subunit M [Roseiarcus sp.]